ncbi:MAG: hypothetical protein GIKADHBN_02335 [Phycisphaerales bacterium]|nr:hypothetical protein [Phycisphaerales bacterium]
MKLSTVVLPVLVGVGAVIAISWSYQYASQQRRAHAAARDLYLATSGQLGELASLKARYPAFAASDAPTEDLTRRVSRVISAAGLASSVLSNVSPDSDQPASSATSAGGTPLYLRRSARLTLEGVTMPQLGRFLEAWRTAEPGWVVTSIDLAATSGSSGGSRIKTPEGGAAPGRDRPLRALLAVEAIVAAGTGAEAEAPGTGLPTSQGTLEPRESDAGGRAARRQPDTLPDDPGVNGRAELIEEPR